MWSFAFPKPLPSFLDFFSLSLSAGLAGISVPGIKLLNIFFPTRRRRIPLLFEGFSFLLVLTPTLVSAGTSVSSETADRDTLFPFPTPLDPKK